MRTLISTAFVSLDGKLDPTGGDPGLHDTQWTFKTVEFLPEAYELKGREQEEAGALLLGRRSYQLFAPAWPGMAEFARYKTLVAQNSVARQTSLGRLLRIDGVGTTEAARAILSVLPLDNAVDDPARRMEIMGAPHEIPPVQQEMQREIDAAEGRPRPMGSIERFAFYEAARRAYCVIATGERRFYGCFVFKKGVIAPEA